MLTDKENIINRKVILLQKGYSQRSLAKAAGCSSAAITFAITGKTKSRSMHEKIVSILDVPIAEFWPEFYGTDFVDEVNTTAAPC